MLEEILVSIFAIFLTIQTAMQYQQGKNINTLVTAMKILVREHCENHGGEAIVCV